MSSSVLRGYLALSDQLNKHYDSVSKGNLDAAKLKINMAELHNKMPSLQLEREKALEELKPTGVNLKEFMPDENAMMHLLQEQKDGDPISSQILSVFGKNVKWHPDTLDLVDTKGNPVQMPTWQKKRGMLGAMGIIAANTDPVKALENQAETIDDIVRSGINIRTGQPLSQADIARLSAAKEKLVTMSKNPTALYNDYIQKMGKAKATAVRFGANQQHLSFYDTAIKRASSKITSFAERQKDIEELATKFTPESVKTYQRTGDISNLVPRNDKDKDYLKVVKEGVYDNVGGVMQKVGDESFIVDTRTGVKTPLKAPPVDIKPIIAELDALKDQGKREELNSYYQKLSPEIQGKISEAMKAREQNPQKPGSDETRVHGTKKPDAGTALKIQKPQDVKIRTKLTDTEDKYFKNHPNTAGMATSDRKVILNPYSKLSPKEKNAVVVNEQLRVFMEDNDIVPDIKITPAQQKTSAGYGSETDIKRTIIARIASGDPSAGDITQEQREYVEKLYGKKGRTRKNKKKKTFRLSNAGYGDIGKSMRTTPSEGRMPQDVRDFAKDQFGKIKSWKEGDFH